jgi:hypothetical protein
VTTAHDTPPVGPDLTPGPRVVASEDLHIERPDLGEGFTTFVRAGEPIPLGLEEMPTRAADDG